ncbi:MAG: metal ABC transporter ATP-binding protein [Armatimonadota bacterium]|nr:metal ABC transporter ATP-binding protein [Armatimonadota bacterium]MDR7498605.1 metal ABC transporter ATP-binding protein [Armatimonadota bacterium]MDR7557958.1 metal ABC transporter ATP-binding protein [Armatimonadota bacterium]
MCYDVGDTRVLEGVTLRIGRGDFLGIIGPNGAGKTTLLRVMLGLLTPSCGHVTLFGTDVRRFRAWYRIGYVPQRPVAERRFPASVFEVVMSGCSARVGPGHRYGVAEREAALQALETVGMAGVRDRVIGRLSPGQQQRVFIARALVHRPELLILDEPTVGVDVDAQEQFYALLRHLNRQLHTTLVLVSHDITVVAREVTRLACLNRSLVFHGDPAEAMRSGALEQLYRAQSLVVAHRH